MILLRSFSLKVSTYDLYQMSPQTVVKQPESTTPQPKVSLSNGDSSFSARKTLFGSIFSFDEPPVALESRPSHLGRNPDPLKPPRPESPPRPR